MKNYLKYLLEDEYQDQDQADLPEEESQQEMPMDDASYIGDDSQQEMMTEPQEAAQAPNSKGNSVEAQQMLHLFKHAQKLYDYTVILKENLKNIDKSSIDVEVVVQLSQLNSVLARFDAKLRDFINEVFYNETYEKNLYTYFTLRYELLAIVKFLRTILHLESIDDEE